MWSASWLMVCKDVLHLQCPEVRNANRASGPPTLPPSPATPSLHPLGELPATLQLISWPAHQRETNHVTWLSDSAKFAGKASANRI